MSSLSGLPVLLSSIIVIRRILSLLLSRVSLIRRRCVRVSVWLLWFLRPLLIRSVRVLLFVRRCRRVLILFSLISLRICRLLRVLSVVLLFVVLM